jgi:hypothetical protein
MALGFSFELTAQPDPNADCTNVLRDLLPPPSFLSICIGEPA